MEKIYMIPVNDAYNESCGCPLCRLRDKAETNYLEYYLGPSLMEPDTRKITNKTGFCPVHMGKLNKAVTNRLGLGLVMHTHLKDFNEDLNPKLKSSIPAKAGLLKGRSPDYKQKLNSVADLIEKRINTCPICENMNDAMGHYIEVICWMFSHDLRLRISSLKLNFIASRTLLCSSDRLRSCHRTRLLILSKLSITTILRPLIRLSLMSSISL